MRITRKIIYINERRFEVVISQWTVLIMCLSFDGDYMHLRNMQVLKKSYMSDWGVLSKTISDYFKKDI